jgi:hypothetical protein
MDAQDEAAAESNVIPFPGVTLTGTEGRSADPNIVALLEDFLERARRGEFEFVGITTVDFQRVAGIATAPMVFDPSITTAAAGAASYLNAHVQRMAIEGEVPNDRPPALA